jgi:uncharacterized cofD-like protein
MRGPKIAVIGGGSGLSTLLRGLKNYTDDISAIVCMTDNGKSSGKLRKDIKMLPPGDIRQCLAALSSQESLLLELFNFRFDKGNTLSGHTLGNLLLAGLTELSGDFRKAVKLMSQILDIKGKVMPVTLDHVQLGAKLMNRRKVFGESSVPIAGHKSKIKRVFLIPNNARVNREAILALQDADLIIIGPGSLYTSIIPNLLFKEITRNLANSEALKIFICNVSTERGETEGFGVADHIKALTIHSNPKILDICLINNKIMKKSSREGRLGGIYNITENKDKIGNVKIRKANIIDVENPLYHDSYKLAREIMKIYWDIL